MGRDLTKQHFVIVSVVLINGLALLGRPHEVDALAFEFDLLSVGHEELVVTTEILNLARLRGFELSLVVNENAAWSDTLVEVVDHILILTSEHFLSIVLLHFKYI